MAKAEDLYEILQVHPSAQPEIIQAAYRRLALLYHPDTNPSPEATAAMAAVNRAYEVLSDTEKRAEYDHSRGAPSRASAEQPVSGTGKRAREEDAVPAALITLPSAPARMTWLEFKARLTAQVTGETLTGWTGTKTCLTKRHGHIPTLPFISTGLAGYKAGASLTTPLTVIATTWTARKLNAPRTQCHYRLILHHRFPQG